MATGTRHGAVTAEAPPDIGRPQPRLVVTSFPARATAQPLLLSPVMRGIAPGQASVVALAPTRSANGELFGAIEGQRGAGLDLCAGVFFVDPFVSAREFVRLLERSEIGAVANWPSVGLFDKPFRCDLARNGLGFEKEIKAIARMASLKFRTTGTAFSLEDALRMQDAGAHVILLHPPIIRGRVSPVEQAIAWGAPIVEKLGKGCSVSLYVEEAATAGLDSVAAPLTVFAG